MASEHQAIWKPLNLEICRVPPAHAHSGRSTGTNDPNPPVGFPQSCPTLSRGFSRFASTKQPFVTSSSRPGADLRRPKKPRRGAGVPQTKSRTPVSCRQFCYGTVTRYA